MANPGTNLFFDDFFNKSTVFGKYIDSRLLGVSSSFEESLAYYKTNEGRAEKNRNPFDICRDLYVKYSNATNIRATVLNNIQSHKEAVIRCFSTVKENMQKSIQSKGKNIFEYYKLNEEYKITEDIHSETMKEFDEVFKIYVNETKKLLDMIELNNRTNPDRDNKAKIETIVLLEKYFRDYLHDLMHKCNYKLGSSVTCFALHQTVTKDLQNIQFTKYLDKFSIESVYDICPKLDANNYVESMNNIFNYLMKIAANDMIEFTDPFVEKSYLNIKEFSDKENNGEGNNGLHKFLEDTMTSDFVKISNDANTQISKIIDGYKTKSLNVGFSKLNTFKSIMPILDLAIYELNDVITKTKESILNYRILL